MTASKAVKPPKQAQSDKQSDKQSAKADPTHGIPERLAKHTVRYADYREVSRDDMPPMMRHYADVKDQHPYALLM